MLLEIRDLAKSHEVPNSGPLPVLRDISLSLDSGATLALTGESGSGKSSLLHLVGALDRFDRGEITLAGTRLSGLGESARAGLRRERIAIVFQQFNLVPSLTVIQNAGLQARMANRHDPHWLAELLGRLGLAKLADRYPEEISGGEQQRVAIARAMATRSELLLADEPTGNLDEANAATVLALMLELVGETGMALFLATHSNRIAAQLDRRVHLTGGYLQ